MLHSALASHVNPLPQRKPALAAAAKFQARLLAWYDAHARSLPWRASRDPYRVWLSEIMLQQTRVAAVIEHYHEFLRRFPTVEKLAAAREANVLAAWSGLGYYRRARMLHAAAKVIAREPGGRFPRSAEGWRELPGIGRYTAAAIASIAFDEPVAVVDGNVERVLQRISGKRLVGEKVWEAAGEMLDWSRPGDFNQAMMELGATMCTPRAPACLTCPVVEMCATRGELAGAAKARRQKRREVDYALASRDRTVFLVLRARDASLMPGMWELPEAKALLAQKGSAAALKRRATQKRDGQKRQVPRRLTPVRNDNVCDSPQLLFTLRHSITVTDYTVRVWQMDAPLDVGGEWVAVDRLARVALTGLARKILRKAGMWPQRLKARRAGEAAGSAEALP